MLSIENSEILKKPKKNYSIKYIQNLINRYIEKSGEFVTLKDGCLGYGLSMLYGEGLKTIIIQEYFINSWESGHTIRKYNKMPKKYENMLYKLYEEEE